MGISSLGAGSGILTQDVLDQLRAADDAQFVKPVDLDIAAEKDKQTQLSSLRTTMSDLQGALADLGAGNDYDKRKATINGDAASVSVKSGVAPASFSLEVTQLATNEIAQSGTFSSKSDQIASGAGSLTIGVGDKSFSIDYDENTTLDDLAKAINKQAGDSVGATVVKIADNQYSLFLSAKNSGENQAISINDDSGNLNSNALSGLTQVQAGQNAKFNYNGVEVQRENNSVDDLIDGVTITLNKLGTSNVNITRDNDALLKSMDDFVTKYNAALSKLNVLTKPSQDADVRGIFSNESIIKDLRGDLQDMLESVGGGGLVNYGFGLDDNNKLTFDKSVFQSKLEENPQNVEAFFSGGTFTNGDGTTSNKRGAFNEMLEKVDSYLGTGKILDEYKKSTDDNLAMYNDRKTSATARLDAKYEILKKQYAAYDQIIARLKSSSQMFSQMIATQYAQQ